MQDMDLFGTSNNESDLERVRRNGMELQFIEHQTPEICLAAVNEYGNALQFVKDQTLEICLEAIAHDGDALRFVIKRFSLTLRH